MAPTNNGARTHPAKIELTNTDQVATVDVEHFERVSAAGPWHLAEDGCAYNDAGIEMGWFVLFGG
jgi:hypothetical protein